MKKTLLLILLLLPFANSRADEGRDMNYNGPDDPMAKQVWIEEHAGRKNTSLNFCNVPGEYDCNIKTKGFRTCGEDLRWGKWKWIGDKEHSEKALNYEASCSKAK